MEEKYTLFSLQSGSDVVASQLFGPSNDVMSTSMAQRFGTCQNDFCIRVPPGSQYIVLFIEGLSLDLSTSQLYMTKVLTSLPSILNMTFILIKTHH